MAYLFVYLVVLGTLLTGTVSAATVAIARRFGWLTQNQLQLKV